MKKIHALSLMVVACSAFAGQIKMPTQAEMKEARSAIRDLVSTGTSISELMSLADETNSGAEKYCLYVEVFKAQAKKEQYADAAETIKRIKEEISGVPESEIVKLIDQHAGKSGNEIPELKAIYQLAHSKMKAEKFVSQIKVELNKNPKDQYLQKSLGEALAISGDWESALTEFAKCDDEVSARAKAEVKGELDGKLAAFWWEYKVDKRFGETGAFKAHAAELYAKLMDGDKLSVIERKVAKKRIEAAKGLTAASDVSGGSVGVQLWKNGPYWAECNVGASNPEDSGYYFWWGSTTGCLFVGNRWESVDGKQRGLSFTSSTCDTWNKSLSILNSAGYIDSGNNLVSKYDAATRYLGLPWRLPTKEEWKALQENCTVVYSTQNGVRGLLVHGKGEYASRCIFIPAGGFSEDASINWLDALCYWAATACKENNLSFGMFANAHCFYTDNRAGRHQARSVRAVRDASSIRKSRRK